MVLWFIEWTDSQTADTSFRWINIGNSSTTTVSSKGLLMSGGLPLGNEETNRDLKNASAMLVGFDENFCWKVLS